VGLGVKVGSKPFIYCKEQRAGRLEVSKDYASIANGQVFMGTFIPDDDMTRTIAEQIGESVNDFRDYIASVRNTEQAEKAVAELLGALIEGVSASQKAIRTAISADELARELGITRAELLERANDEFDWVSLHDGADAARKLVVYILDSVKISAPLADRLRHAEPNMRPDSR
jgi:hypothetical protein